MGFLFSGTHCISTCYVCMYKVSCQWAPLPLPEDSNRDLTVHVVQELQSPWIHSLSHDAPRTQHVLSSSPGKISPMSNSIKPRVFWNPKTVVNLTVLTYFISKPPALSREQLCQDFCDSAKARVTRSCWKNFAMPRSKRGKMTTGN